MRASGKKLLIVDGIVNLLLGGLLLCFPFGMAAKLGLPVPDHNFYPTILGAVLCGIGIALLMEACGDANRTSGLGVAGAIVINFCGAGTLTLWLIFNSLNIPLRGLVILWAIALVVWAIGCVELVKKDRRH